MIDLNKESFKTNRLLLRKFSEADLDDLYAYASVPETAEMAGWKYHETIEDSEITLNMLMRAKNVYAIELLEKDKVIGSLGLTPRGEGLELGYVLSVEYWGEGLEVEALNVVINYCFEHLGVEKVYRGYYTEHAIYDTANEALGFEFLEKEMANTLGFGKKERVLSVLNIESFDSLESDFPKIESVVSLQNDVIDIDDNLLICNLEDESSVLLADNLSLNSSSYEQELAEEQNNLEELENLEIKNSLAEKVEQSFDEENENSAFNSEELVSDQIINDRILELDAKNLELNEILNNFRESESSLVDILDQMSYREELLNEKLDLISKNGNSLKSALLKMENREEAINSKLEEIETREYEINTKLKELEVKEKDVNLRLQEIEAKEGYIIEKLDEIELRESFVNEKLEKIELQEASLSAQLKEIEMREDNTNLNLSEIRMREESVKKSLSELENKENDVNIKIEELEYREERINANLEEIETLKQSLSERIDALEEKAELFSISIDGLEDREKEFVDNPSKIKQRQNVVSMPFNSNQNSKKIFSDSPAISIVNYSANGSLATVPRSMAVDFKEETYKEDTLVQAETAPNTEYRRQEIADLLNEVLEDDIIENDVEKKIRFRKLINNKEAQRLAKRLYKKNTNIFERIPFRFLLSRSKLANSDFLAAYENGEFIGFTYLQHQRKKVLVPILFANNRKSRKAIIDNLKTLYPNKDLSLVFQ